MEQLRLWGAQLLAVLQDTVQGLMTYLPVALTAAAVLLVGWLLARAIRGLLRRALQSMDPTENRQITAGRCAILADQNRRSDLRKQAITA